jgi:hypothetical protein
MPDPTVPRQEGCLYGLVSAEVAMGGTKGAQIGLRLHPLDGICWIHPRLWGTVIRMIRRPYNLHMKNAMSWASTETAKTGVAAWLQSVRPFAKQP